MRSSKQTAVVSTRRPQTYIAGNADGSYDAFVGYRGFRANSTLAECLQFIREQTGRSQGAVGFYDRLLNEWGSEFDLSEATT